MGHNCGVNDLPETSRLSYSTRDGGFAENKLEIQVVGTKRKYVIIAKEKPGAPTKLNEVEKRFLHDLQRQRQSRDEKERTEVELAIRAQFMVDEEAGINELHRYNRKLEE